MTSGSPSHDLSHDPLVEAVLSGELDSGDVSARPLQACAVCQQRLQRRRELTQALDAAGSEQRDILAAVRAAPPAPGEERVPFLVRSRWRRPRPWVLWLNGLAALLFVALFFVADCERRPGLPDDLTLARSGRVHPVSKVREFVPFRWEGALAPGEAFVVEVTDADDATGKPFLVSPELRANSWMPAERARLDACRRIRWTVLVAGPAAHDRRLLVTLGASRE